MRERREVGITDATLYGTLKDTINALSLTQPGSTLSVNAAWSCEGIWTSKMNHRDSTLIYPITSASWGRGRRGSRHVRHEARPLPTYHLSHPLCKEYTPLCGYHRP